MLTSNQSHLQKSQQQEGVQTVVRGDRYEHRGERGENSGSEENLKCSDLYSWRSANFVAE